jgi:hypothetical protein
MGQIMTCSGIIWNSGKMRLCAKENINSLNAELNPICYLLALGAHHILHVGKIRVNAVAVDKG